MTVELSFGDKVKDFFSEQNEKTKKRQSNTENMRNACNQCRFNTQTSGGEGAEGVRQNRSQLSEGWCQVILRTTGKDFFFNSKNACGFHDNQ